MKLATRETYAILKTCISLRLENLKEDLKRRRLKSAGIERAFQPSPPRQFFHPPYIWSKADFGAYIVYLS